MSSAASSSASPKSPDKGSKEDSNSMFEDLAELSVRYADDLAQLRAILAAATPPRTCDDDLVCYRFLRGHKFDHAVAASHLQTTLAWREEHALDSLRARAEKMDQRAFPHADKVLAVHPHNIIHGFDRKGQPLSIERLGHANPYLMVRTVPFAEMQSYHFHHMESKASIVAALSHKTGKVIRTAKIMDLSGLGRQHLDRRGLAYFKRLLDMSQGSYPEMLGDLYIVNQPWIFSLGWKIVRPWLHEKTLHKIHILPTDPAEIQRILREAVPEEHLPDWLGGQCCCEHQGGCVPLRDPDAGRTTTQIGARSRFEHLLRVDRAEFERIKAEFKDGAALERAAATPCPAEGAEVVPAFPAAAADGAASASPAASSLAAPAAAAASSSAVASSPSPSPSPAVTLGAASSFKGVLVRYEFRTLKNDVAFEVRAKPIDDGEQHVEAAAASAAAPAAAAAPAVNTSSWPVLLASKRYESDAETVVGSFVLSSPSTVSFVWDNSFSWMSGKTLLWKIELDAAVEEQAAAAAGGASPAEAGVAE